MLAERQQPARVPPASLLHACKKRASLFRFLHEILARDSCTPLAQFSEVLHASCTPTGHLHACKLRARGLYHTSSLNYLRYHFPDVKRARACTCWSYSCTLKKHEFSVQEVSLARLFARFSFAVTYYMCIHAMVTTLCISNVSHAMVATLPTLPKLHVS